MYVHWIVESYNQKLWGDSRHQSHVGKIISESGGTALKRFTWGIIITNLETLYLLCASVAEGGQWEREFFVEILDRRPYTICVIFWGKKIILCLQFLAESRMSQITHSVSQPHAYISSNQSINPSTIICVNGCYLLFSNNIIVRSAGDHISTMINHSHIIRSKSTKCILLKISSM